MTRDLFTLLWFPFLVGGVVTAVSGSTVAGYFTLTALTVCTAALWFRRHPA